MKKAKAKAKPVKRKAKPVQKKVTEEEGGDDGPKDESSAAAPRAYNPELLLRFDPTREEDISGFVGEKVIKRSDHARSVPKLYALAFNHVDVRFPYGKPYQKETMYGRRWIFRVIIVGADQKKHKLTVMQPDGTYQTSWFAPTFKLSKCGACEKVFRGKHIDVCDCGSKNIKKFWECRTEDDFKKVMEATGWDVQRWKDFTYRMSVTQSDRGFDRFAIDLLDGPSDAKPTSKKAKSLLQKAADDHWDANVREKVEASLVPVVQKMAKHGDKPTVEDWVATLVSDEIGVKTEAEAEALWEHRYELKGWPKGV